MGYTLITIVTTSRKVEMTLLKVISQYTSLDVVPLRHLSLGSATWVGGAVVHIKSALDQPAHHVTQTDMVLTYDADLIGTRLCKVLATMSFQSNPSLLHLCTIGTPEHKFLKYFTKYTQTLGLQQHCLSHETLLIRPDATLETLLEQNPTVFAEEDFKAWNDDAIAVEVAQWFIEKNSKDYEHKSLQST